MCNCDRQLLLQVAKVTTVRMCGVEQEDCRMHISNKELMRSNETTEVDEDLHRHHRMDPLRNITQSESSSISDKDNHKSQQVSNDKMLHSSRTTSWSSSSESMTNDSRKFSHQSGQRRRSSCVSKKGSCLSLFLAHLSKSNRCLLAIIPWSNNYYKFWWNNAKCATVRQRVADLKIYSQYSFGHTPPCVDQVEKSKSCGRHTVAVDRWFCYQGTQSKCSRNQYYVRSCDMSRKMCDKLINPSPTSFVVDGARVQ